MRIGRALGGLAIAAWVALASCSVMPRAVIRNASGEDLVLFPLAAQPSTLKAGETTAPIIYSGHQRQEALIERRGCLYTYPAPDYFALPKSAKGYASAIAVVINPDMSLSAFPRSKKGVEGPEILVAGFPLEPATFCGKRG
jgi:hypothetical protein